jgi:peptidoglycan/LPS O-acetylase OafA/YrhL
MIKYRTEIDGLRTVAVIPVILFHLGYSFVKGGFYGVNVFFVISGYLITKILTGDIENGNFSMYRFWLRRVKRLLPLLLTVILVTLIITPLLVFKPVVKDISQDIFPALFSYFNFHALHDFGDYWGGAAEQSFFLHTWSLSVEEQFYLLYPIFLFLSYKYFKNFVFPIFTITIISFFLFLFYVKINQDIDTAFYMLPTRIWELSIGGLSGLITFQKFKNLNSKITKFLPIIGILFIVSSYLLGNKTLWILPVLGTALIILFSTTNDVIGKLLSTQPFVFIGKISYSLYLWHWGIIVLFKNLKYQFQDINHHLINGLIISLTFLLAYLSYTFIENKTRKYKHTPKIVLAGIALIAGMTFYLQSDFYSPYYNSKYNQQINYVKYYDIAPSLNGLDDFLNKNSLGYDFLFPDRLQKFNDAYKKEGIITNEKYGAPKIMLIGDSHAVMWGKLLNEISNKLGVTLSCYTANGSKPFFNIRNINSQSENEYFTQIQRTDYAKSIILNIEKWKPKLVILVCRWSINDEINELISYLEKRNISVLLFTQPPVLNFMVNKNASQYFTYLGLKPIFGYKLIKVNNSYVEKNNDYIKSLVTKHTNVSIYDVYDHMILDNKIKISLDNYVLYFDDDHLSYYGTFTHKQNILSKINSIVNLNNENETNWTNKNGSR